MKTISWIAFLACIVGLNAQTPDVPQHAIGRVKCIEPLGCFDIDGPFYHLIYRPVNLMPFDREFINVRYRIYTKGQGDKYQLLQALKVLSTNVSDINIDPKLETKIVVHGWIDNQFVGDWMRDYKDEYFKKGNYNFVVVDWSGGNLPPYTQAVANTRVVGAEIALLVKTLQNKKGLDPRKVHIIGHSLGGQIVGYAGAGIKNLGRITSLDPAEPLYQYMPPEVRIDPTDAEFVEVIHSDSSSILLGGLGMAQLAGHVDFFPNNGRTQPGCKLDQLISIHIDGLIEGFRNLVACNHVRAVSYFKESINSPTCQFVHFACPDYATFLAGKCIDCGKKGERCAILGERSIEFAKNKNSSKSVQMFATTNHMAPYCLFQYQVQVRLEVSSKKEQNGDFFLTLDGETGPVEYKLGESGQTFYPGALYTYLVTSKDELGKIDSVSFRWKTSKKIVLIKPKIFLNEITVKPMNEMDQTARASKSLTVCAKSSSGVESGKNVIFKKFTKC